ncbi:MAG: hypothetical protein ACFFKA_18925 [Candidatus Thorarchaeota archaeon]
MINNNLAKNWEKIIKFNSKIEMVDNPMSFTDKVQIPLTSIEISAYLLYYIFQEFYPKLLNDQLNVIDVIISDYEIDNIVLKAFVYQMNKPGIHQNVKEIDKNDITLKFKDLNDCELIFSQLQSSLKKKLGLKISNFRMIKKRGLDLINRHMENINKYSFSELIESILDLIQTLIKKDLIILYPQPPIINFLKECFLAINNLKLSKIFHYIERLLDYEDVSIILKSKIFPILITWKRNPQLNKPNDKILSIDWIKIPDNSRVDLEKVRLELKHKYTLSLDLIVVIDYFVEVIETKIPISQEKLTILFQKLLFGIRSYQTFWNVSPKPLFTHFLLRFLLRIIGIDLNINKLSHWVIPEFLLSLLNPYSGMQGKVLLILTDQDSRLKENRLFILLNFENGAIIKVEEIELGIYSSEAFVKNLTELKLQVSKTLGFLSLIIKIDKNLLQFIMEGFISNIHRISIFKILNLIRLLKNPNYFEINPPIPLYTFIRSKSIYTIVKTIFSISTDKHNF